jgi:hypothetical protein
MKARKRAKPAGSSHVTSDKVSLKIKIPFKGCYHEDGTAMNIASAPGLLLLIAMTKRGERKLPRRLFSEGYTKKKVSSFALF